MALSVEAKMDMVLPMEVKLGKVMTITATLAPSTHPYHEDKGLLNW
jgi:hypothetical protein